VAQELRLSLAGFRILELQAIKDKASLVKAPEGMTT
jgi:hypothetical protein